MRAEELTAEFGIAGLLDFVETEHGLVKAAISLDGVTGELCLQGAQVTAWRLSDKRPVLFTSPNSAFAPGRAIRGGIPIIFPWFGPSRHTPTARFISGQRGRRPRNIVRSHTPPSKRSPPWIKPASTGR